MAQAVRNSKKNSNTKSNKIKQPKGKLNQPASTNSIKENGSEPRMKPAMRSFETDSNRSRANFYTEPVEYQGDNYDYPDRSEEPFSKDAGQTDQVYHRYDQGSSIRGPYAGKGPQGYHRSDERIHEEICEILTRHPSIDAKNIEVEVKDGEVLLSGTVPERYMKYFAEEEAANSFGVTDVVNNIRLKKEGEEKVSATTPKSTSQHTSIEEGPLSS
ncbi:MAG: BON domain-containing protein [Bdellovibrio sp.]